METRPGPDLWQHRDEPAHFDIWAWILRVLGGEELSSMAGISEIVCVAEAGWFVGFVVAHFVSSFFLVVVLGM